jgi:hypothetical protein
MNTQLRLVDTPRERPASGSRRARTVRGRAARPVRWSGDWRLDTKTRRVGREGVAAAREALARASDLRKAS